MADFRRSGSSVLLPGLDRVLALGGENPKTGEVTATAEVLDLSAPDPSWRPTAPMAFGRIHTNAVLLPDGSVLVVGGGFDGRYGNPVKTTELFDPETETWTTMASQVAPRVYHSTAVLLPDGRVLSMGMDAGGYQRTYEIFSPPYLFRGARPHVSSSPEQVSYGEAFTVSSPEAGRIERVALVRPGSVTHGVDFEQRYLDLSFYSTGLRGLNVTAPADALEAPPGWYMLFLVDDVGVPSVASWVHVS